MNRLCSVFFTFCWLAWLAPVPGYSDDIGLEPTGSATDDFGLKKNRAISHIGDYKVYLGISRPTFSDDLKYYEEIYNNVSWYPSLKIDWTALEIGVLGFGTQFSLGYYSDEGEPLTNIEASNPEDDENSKVNLTLVPVQLSFQVGLSPFDSRFLSFTGWIGGETLYFSEKRESIAGQGSAESESSSASNSTQTFANTGWKNAIVVGAAMHIKISQFDQVATSSMRHMLGFGFIYLSPYFQVINSTANNGIAFSRNEIGVNFVFETM